MACVVLLLFPIVSASDDLQAMRPEVEESTSRDSHRFAQGCRHDAAPDHAGILFALPGSSALIPGLQYAGQVAALVVEPRVALMHAATDGRAPPASHLA